MGGKERLFLFGGERLTGGGKNRRMASKEKKRRKAEGMAAKRMVAWAVAAAMGAASGTALGNVGVFRGSGQTPVVEKTDAVQLVEEEVTMRPREGTHPIDLSASNSDPMDFECRFLLRNLTDEEVHLQVGFPLDAEDGGAWSAKEEDVAELVEEFRFSARTNGGACEVRFVPFDRDRKFSKLFLWDMSFAPREEVELAVEYRMGGYFGLGPCETLTGENPWTVLEDYENENWAAKLFFMGIAEGHFYVTGTASCWAGEVERAVFRYHPQEFEDYLRARSAFEESPEQRAGREESLADFDPGDSWVLLKPELPMVRNWLPNENEWTRVDDGDGRWHLEWSQAPFKPSVRAGIAFFYVAPPMPTAPEDAGRLVAIANALGVSARDICDICREFYGVETGNERIREFVRRQCWHDTQWRPGAPEGLLEALERAGGTPSGDETPE